ncbi:MAG: hypothetical protein QW726_06245 [Fervidicoccaceae archaeon]
MKSEDRRKVIVNGVTQVVTKAEGEGAINAFNVTTQSTPIRICDDVALVKRIVLLADSSNTATIYVGIGTDTNENQYQPTFPLTAGSELILEDVIPYNIFVSSTSTGQVLHVIYSEGKLWESISS